MKIINNITETVRDDMKETMTKNHCAREHFKAIGGDKVVYDVVDSYTALMERVMK